MPAAEARARAPPPPRCVQPSPGPLLRLDPTDAWFADSLGAGDAGFGALPLADLFKEPAPVLNL